MRSDFDNYGSIVLNNMGYYTVVICPYTPRLRNVVVCVIIFLKLNFNFVLKKKYILNKLLRLFQKRGLLSRKVKCLIFPTN